MRRGDGSALPGAELIISDGSYSVTLTISSSADGCVVHLTLFTCRTAAMPRSVALL